MPNNRRLGTAREGLCLNQFKQYMEKKPDYKLVAEWRSIASKFQNVDLWSSFDLALAYRYKSIIVPYLIQCKSRYGRQYYNALKEQWRDFNGHCYLAVYKKGMPKGLGRVSEGEGRNNNISLKDFTLLRL